VEERAAAMDEMASIRTVLARLQEEKGEGEELVKQLRARLQAVEERANAEAKKQIAAAEEKNALLEKELQKVEERLEVLLVEKNLWETQKENHPESYWINTMRVKDQSIVRLERKAARAASQLEAEMAKTPVLERQLLLKQKQLHQMEDHIIEKTATILHLEKTVAHLSKECQEISANLQAEVLRRRELEETLKRETEIRKRIEERRGRIFKPVPKSLQNASAAFQEKLNISELRSKLRPTGVNLKK
jgi:chromosome segregation ATPase